MFCRAWPLLGLLSIARPSNGGETSSAPNATTTSTTSPPAVRPWPVMLVPGIAGSTLMARYVNSTLGSCTPNEMTAINSDWFRLWISLTNFRPPRRHQKCWFETITLETDETDSTVEQDSSKDQYSIKDRGSSKEGSSIVRLPSWRNAKGVEVNVEEGLRGVDYLDYLSTYGFSPTRYFHDIISHLSTYGGYKADDSLRAFPYDWRLPVWQLDLQKLRTEIETLYETNDKKSVVLVCHSMGMIVTNYFLLKEMGTAWSQKYIKAIILINGAAGGSVKALRAMLSGYDPTNVSWLKYLDLPQLMGNDDMKQLCSSLGSLFMLVPHFSVFHPKLPVVSFTHAAKEAFPSLTVPLAKVLSLLAPAIAPRAESVREFVQKYAFADPGVPVYCIYSRSSLPTTELHLVYNDTTLDSDPKLVLAQGDGTLPVKSMKLCTEWKSTRLVKEFVDVDHMFVLRSPQTLKLVQSILSSLH